MGSAVVACAAVVTTSCGTDSPRGVIRAVDPSASPPASALDFTATLLPPGLRYGSTEHGPPNQFEEVIKRYWDASRSHVLIIDVNRGDVMTPKLYADESGGFAVTKIDGHPAAVGANHGRDAAGNVEVFVQVARGLTIDVEDRGGLSLSEVTDVLRGVRVN